MSPKIALSFLSSVFILFPMTVSAQSGSVSSSAAADSTVPEEARSFVVADVNVGDVQAVETDGIVSGTFSLRGGMGQQNRIAFAVVVRGETGILLHVQPIESEVTFIREGEIKTIPFSYRLPSFLGGRVAVFVQAETTDGLSLGTQKAIEKNLPDISRPPVICATMESAPAFSCYVEKEGRDVSIQYYPRSLFVPAARKDEGITIGGTAKTISPDLPAGRYWIAIEEVETGRLTYFPFHMPGSYGQIKNAVVSRDQKSGKVQATILVGASPLKGTVVAIELRDRQGNICANAVAENDGPVKEVSFSVTCEAGTLVLQLKNVEGTVLSSLEEPFSLLSTSATEAADLAGMPMLGEDKKRIPVATVVLLALLVTLAVFGALLFYRNRHHRLKAFLLFAAFGAGMFGISTPQAAAISQYTYLWSGGFEEIAWECSTTTDSDKASYSPGETMVLTSAGLISSDVGARTNGTCSVSYFQNTAGTTAAFDAEPVGSLVSIAASGVVNPGNLRNFNNTRSFAVSPSLASGAHSVRRIYTSLTGGCWGGCSGTTSDSDALLFSVAPSCVLSCGATVSWNNALPNPVVDFSCPATQKLVISGGGSWSGGSCGNGTYTSPTAPADFSCVDDLSCTVCRTGTTVQSNDVCAANCSFNADIYRVRNPSTGAYNQGWWNTTAAPGICSGTCAGYPLSGHTMAEISSIPVCATPAPPICVLGANAWTGLTVPNFWFGGAASGISERIKTSLCPAGQVMTGTRSWQHHNQVDEEYEEARCAPVSAGFGAPAWYEAPNAYADLRPGDKTVMCPAGQVMVGTRMYGVYSSVDEEHIDAYCSTPPVGTTLGAPVRVNGSGAVLSSQFKETLCPPNHVMVGVNWFQWGTGLDEEHTDAFCAPVTLACGPACAWEAVDEVNGFAEVQNNSRSEDICVNSEPTWFIPNVCPGTVAVGGDSSAYASGYTCHVAASKFKGFAPTYETGMCMATAYRSVCTGAGASVFATPGAVVTSVPDTWWQKLWKYLRGDDYVAQASGSASIVVNQNLDLGWTSSGVSSCTITPSLFVPGFPLVMPPMSINNGSYAIPANSLSPGTTYTFTISCTGPSGNASDSTSVIVAPPTDFKVCPMTPAPIAPAATSQMRAYYVTSGTVNCGSLAGAIEVTTDPSTNWSSANAGIATVDNAGSKGRITAVASGTTSVSATYLTSSDSENITVSCTPTAACTDAGPSATAANTCASDTFNINDGCSGTIVCNGTRTCDFNWKEVGQ